VPVIGHFIFQLFLKKWNVTKVRVQRRLLGQLMFFQRIDPITTIHKHKTTIRLIYEPSLISLPKISPKIDPDFSRSLKIKF
jgi:hypothetical protein